MNSRQFKKNLHNNPHLIIDILEELGCHEIKHVPNKRIMAALPDGDNVTSVQVLLENDYLTTVVHTRNDYDGGDIFDFISYIKECKFRNSFLFASKVTNTKIDFTYKPVVRNETFDFLNKFTRSEQLEFSNAENIVLDEGVLNQYIKTAHKMFLDDHLSVESQYKFDIHYDLHGHRILIPIRDTEGNLVTIKGRTVLDDDKVEKYIAYYPYAARNILYGYYENFWDILSKKEVILAESEKAVIQANSYGVNNVLAISKKKISDEQLYKIISLNVDVVLALDKDVKMDELEIIADEFKGLCNVYVIYDNKELLKNKESPFDRGADVFHELYSNKIRLL